MLVAGLVIEQEGQGAEDAHAAPPLAVELGPKPVADATGLAEVVVHDQRGKGFGGVEEAPLLGPVAADGGGEHAHRNARTVCDVPPAFVFAWLAPVVHVIGAARQHLLLEPERGRYG